MRGQIAVRPVGRAALRIGEIGQHDKRGQILVLRAESVGRPRANRRIAAELVAGVQVVQRGRMVDAFGFQSPVEAQVVHHVREIGEQRVDLDPQTAGAAELERTAHVVALAGVHVGLELIALLLKLCHVELFELRLRIERVDVTGPALHEQEDALLRLCGMVRLPGAEDTGSRLVASQQRRQRNRAKSHAGVVEELAARRRRGGDRCRALAHGGSFQ